MVKCIFVLTCLCSLFGVAYFQGNDISHGGGHNDRHGHAQVNHGTSGTHGNNFHIERLGRRPTDVINPQGSHSGNSGGTHVDMPGQHGNSALHPVVHRPHIAHGGGTHVDMPGEHGNTAPHPVVHRQHGSQGAGTHVDMPGEHGNTAPHPVVHRPNSGAGTHVDMPGEHGNTAPHPVVHRPDSGTGTHVDMPGEHGNTAPHPVVHRPGVDTHVDMPREHGNTAPHPVVHRPGVDTHVDMPGEHGNTALHHAVHRPNRHQGGVGSHIPNSGGEVHVDLPGQHGNEFPFASVHRSGERSSGRPDHHRHPQQVAQSLSIAPVHQRRTIRLMPPIRGPPFMPIHRRPFFDPFGLSAVPFNPMFVDIRPNFYRLPPPPMYPYPSLVPFQRSYHMPFPYFGRNRGVMLDGGSSIVRSSLVGALNSLFRQ